MARIAEVETFPLREPTDRSGDLDGANATFVVRITDEDGVSGIGEADAPPEMLAAAFEMADLHAWSRSLKGPLIGADPMAFAALWERLYEAAFWHGRRGLGIHALSAIDIALYDLVGRRLRVPVWKLLGGARVDRLTPYATIFPGLPQGRSLSELMAVIEGQFATALDLGFKAVKMEVVFEGLADDRRLAGLIGEARRMLGDETTLMLDFGYRWTDWRAALALLRRVEECDIYFAEAALKHDDLAGHAKLAARSPIRVCGAEAAATRFEIREWIETGGVDIVQPNIGRAGGFTEMRRIAEMCQLAGVSCVPHGWKTGITAAASMHFQAACPNVPFIEYLAPELYPAPLRRELVTPARYPIGEDGTMALPDAPGLGVELNDEALDRYAMR